MNKNVGNIADVLTKSCCCFNDNAKSVGDKRRRMKSCFGGDKHPVALAMSVLVETNTNSSKKGQIGEKF